MASATHGHTFCTHLLFFKKRERLRAGMETVENVNADLEEAKEKTSRVFDVENQTLTYNRSREVCNRSSRRKDLFHASLSEKAVHYWKKVLTWNSLLEMVRKATGGEIWSQHTVRASTMTNDL